MNANRLKLLMMGLMVLDHISYFVPPEWALIFHVITRCVGVFFGYMAVEGFNYTRNVYRYNGRLYIGQGDDRSAQRRIFRRGQKGHFVADMNFAALGQQSCLLKYWAIGE